MLNAAEGKVLLIVTGCEVPAEQVVAVIVSITATVPELPVPHVTVIWCVFCPAVMLPPVTVHNQVCPATEGVE